MKDENSNVWLDTMSAAIRYRVSPDMLRTWKRWHGFPMSAVVRDANQCFWNIEELDEWLRARPLHKNGRPPRWPGIVNHPQANSI